MSDLEDAAAVLADAVLIDSSPQADALAAEVAAHIAARPQPKREQSEVPDLLRVFMSNEQIEELLARRREQT